MSALAVADPTTLTRTARPAHVGRPRAVRLHSVPDNAGAEPLTVTISIDGGSRVSRDRVLAVLRDLVATAGSDGAVALEPASAPESAEGAIRLEPRPRTILRDGWPLHLSRLEYDLLLFLARHPRQVFSRGQLLDRVWGHPHTTARTVDVHVSRLRTKLGGHGLITTVYGLGYRLADDAAITVIDQ